MNQPTRTGKFPPSTISPQLTLFVSHQIHSLGEMTFVSNIAHIRDELLDGCQPLADFIPKIKYTSIYVHFLLLFGRFCYTITRPLEGAREKCTAKIELKKAYKARLSENDRREIDFQGSSFGGREQDFGQNLWNFRLRLKAQIFSRKHAFNVSPKFCHWQSKLKLRPITFETTLVSYQQLIFHDRFIPAYSYFITSEIIRRENKTICTCTRPFHRFARRKFRLPENIELRRVSNFQNSIQRVIIQVFDSPKDIFSRNYIIYVLLEDTVRIPGSEVAI
ncbi:hypothetical protein ACFE04_026802 [Oxalis oulophora]